MTEITQADRDAAARAWAEDNDEPLDCHICEQIRAGYGDNSLDVIRFARHRMEATEALSAENERLREAQESVLPSLEHYYQIAIENGHPEFIEAAMLALHTAYAALGDEA